MISTYARNRVSAYDVAMLAHVTQSTQVHTHALTSTYDGTYSRIRNSAFAADYAHTYSRMVVHSRVRASAYTRTRLTTLLTVIRILTDSCTCFIIHS